MMRYNFVLPNLSVTGPTPGKLTTDSAKALPADFVPSKDDVMCGRGKKCYEHNEKFRSVIATHLEEYSSAPSKPEKSRIVSTVFDEITSNGQFVRFDTKKKQWVSVPEGTSREKISQGFRDCLTDQYRSSKDCRQRKRKQAREELKNVEAVLSSSSSSDRPTKKARPSSPPTLVKTSDALQQLLAFSQQMSAKSVSSATTTPFPPLIQTTSTSTTASSHEEPTEEIITPAPEKIESTLPTNDDAAFAGFEIPPSFHPVRSSDLRRPSFRASRRFCGSVSSIAIDLETAEELVAFSAMSA